MPFYLIFEDIFIFLMTPHNNIIVMAAFIIAHIIVVGLRIVTFLGYRGHNMWMTVDLSPSKTLVTLSDTEGIRSQLLRRITADYIAAANKNAPRVPLDSIVDKHVLDLSAFGWRYTGMLDWCGKMESGLVLVGIILALIFPEYSVVYGVLAVLGFIILKFASSCWDGYTAQALIKSDIKIYMEREVGRFFASHMTNAVSEFKEEIVKAIDRQEAFFTHLQCLSNLPEALEHMLRSNDRYALHHEGFVSQVQMIKDVQSTLEKSLAAYEATLQNLVMTMGSGMGAAIQMHGQKAADNLSVVLQEHIKQINGGNQETISQITALIGSLNDQSKNISASLRVLHERVEDM